MTRASRVTHGTLRFAAITAVFFQPDMPGILTIEEIENGRFSMSWRMQAPNAKVDVLIQPAVTRL